MLHLPSINHVKQRCLSANKATSSKASDIEVPTLTPQGKERKREQDEYFRLCTLEDKVDKHIEIAKKNAQKAQEVLNKDIEYMTSWLESCDVKIGEL